MLRATRDCGVDEKAGEKPIESLLQLEGESGGKTSLSTELTLETRSETLSFTTVADKLTPSYPNLIAKKIELGCNLIALRGLDKPENRFVLFSLQSERNKILNVFNIFFSQIGIARWYTRLSQRNER